MIGAKLNFIYFIGYSIFRLIGKTVWSIEVETELVFRSGGEGNADNPKK